MRSLVAVEALMCVGLVNFEIGMHADCLHEAQYLAPTDQISTLHTAHTTLLAPLSRRWKEKITLHLPMP